MWSTDATWLHWLYRYWVYSIGILFRHSCLEVMRVNLGLYDWHKGIEVCLGVVCFQILGKKLVN